ncbi:MAG: hypothetical protein LQ351_004336 [Letrouitia transgressa]|nr:MAG: hypothetical protein LQ351_004336 [Letrouitia transgressa]
MHLSSIVLFSFVATSLSLTYERPFIPKFVDGPRQGTQIPWVEYLGDERFPGEGFLSNQTAALDAIVPKIPLKLSPTTLEFPLLEYLYTGLMEIRGMTFKSPQFLASDPEHQTAYACGSCNSIKKLVNLNPASKNWAQIWSLVHDAYSIAIDSYDDVTDANATFKVALNHYYYPTDLDGNTCVTIYVEALNGKANTATQGRMVEDLTTHMQDLDALCQCGTHSVDSGFGGGMKVMTNGDEAVWRLTVDTSAPAC